MVSYYYYYYFLLIRIFHISVSWWSFTGDWVTASLLKSPGLFSVFWPFSIKQLFGWSPLGRQLPNLPGPLIITVPKAPITIGIIVTMFCSFFQFSSKVEVLVSLFTFFQFYSVVSRDSKVDNFADFLSFFFFFGWLLQSLVFWPRLGDPFVYKSPIGVCVCHFLGADAGLCIYHLLAWSNLNSCTFPSGSPCPPSGSTW